SMYADLTEKRNLGQMLLVIDPSRLTDSERFKENIFQMVEDLHSVPTAEGFQQVYFPGEIGQLNYQKAMSEGNEIPQSIYDYLVCEIVDSDKYGGQGAFA
ncbi:Ldh family oxidoreductase, partial [Enterococcus faecalis]|uniref:Ldh family oxidoreductase n=1 Tax=Enterococcus faecalis TaxID=1351 RepID=UPI003CC5D8C0